MSIFGAMFAPDQERAAAELLRVVRPGGRIGMANWTPDGGISKMFAVLAKHAGGPPPGTVLPVLWGTEERVRELFGDGVTEVRFERRVNRQAFRSPQHYLDFFRTYFGPLKTTFDKLGPEGAPALEADLLAYLEEGSSDERALVLEPEYLQVVAVRA
jgi:SAM-dependent methyltransferase